MAIHIMSHRNHLPRKLHFVTVLYINFNTAFDKVGGGNVLWDKFGKAVITPNMTNGVIMCNISDVTDAIKGDLSSFSDTTNEGCYSMTLY